MKRTWLSISLVLVAMTGGCASTSEAEPEASASESELRTLTASEVLGAIPYGTTKTVTHSGTPKYRAYYFDAKAGDVLDVTVRGRAATTDALLWLTDSSMKTLAYNDDADGNLEEDTATTNDARVKFTVKSDGRYYVVFRNKLNRSASFDVRVDRTAAPPLACGLLTTICATGCCEVPDFVVRPPVTGNAFRWQASPSIATDSAGNMYIAYTTTSSGSWTSAFAKYEAATQTWKNTELWTEGGYHPVVRVDRAGAIHVVYSAPSNSRRAAYFYSTDGGATFTKTDLAGSIAIGGQCDLTLDAQNRPHVTCDVDQGAGRRGPLYLTKRSDAWTSEFLGGGVTGLDTYGTTRIGVWNAPDGTAQPRILGNYGKYAFWNGNRWVSESFSNAQNHTGNWVERQSLTLSVTDSDQVRAMYYQEPSRTVFTAERGPNGWTSKAELTLTADAPLTSLAGLTDSSGRFVAAVTGGLRVLKANANGVWTLENLANRGGNMPSAVPSGNHYYIAYEGVGTGVDHALMLTRVAK